MKNANFVLAILAVALVAVAPLPQQPAVELARFLPPGAVAYAETGDLTGLLAAVLDSGPASALPKSRAWADFTVSKLYNKITDRIDTLEQATGFGLTLENLREAAGGPSAIALYDIGELRFVFLTRLPMAKVAATSLWDLRTSFDERRTDSGQQYYVKEDEIGRVALAFAVSGDLFIVGTDVPQFEQTLALVKGSGASLAADERFSEAFTGMTAEGNLTVYLDQEAIAATPYFRSYWIFGNTADLAPIRRVGIIAAIEAGGISEHRRLVREGAASSAGDTSALVAALPGGAYLECGTLAGAGGLVPIVKGLFAGIEDADATAIAAALTPASGDTYALTWGINPGTAPLAKNIEAAVAIRLAKPAALDRRALEAAIARSWEKRLLYAGQGSFTFVDRAGARTLNLPLFEDSAPAWKLGGDVLVLAGSNRFLAAPPAVPGAFSAAAQGSSFALRFTAGPALKEAADYLRLLAARTNWQSENNGEFWSLNLPSVFGMFAGMEEMTLVRTSGADAETEVVTYRFAGAK